MILIWPHYLSDMQKWKKGCTICTERCEKNKLGEIGHPPISLRYNDVCSDDLMTLPTSLKGNRYLLLYIDHFSRYVSAAALQDKSSSSVTEKRGNGMIERANKTAINFLRAIDRSDKLWDEHLIDLCEIFNYTTHSSTSYSPY